MDELHILAKTYYQASSNDIKKLADDFFRAMDIDRDGKIDYKEFLEFMRAEGYCRQMKNLSFFKQLDRHGNGTLDFDEVTTLYYIMKSGRPICDCCKKFIPSTYLICVGCLENPVNGSFYLCLDCYKENKCDHTHNHLSRFLDNYVLLEAMINSKTAELVRSKPFGTFAIPNNPHSGNNQTWNPSLAMVQVPYGTPPVYNHHPWRPYTPAAPQIHNQTWIQNNHSYNYTPSPPCQLPTTSTAIVPHKASSETPMLRPEWSTALAALNWGVQLGCAFCSIL